MSNTTLDDVLYEFFLNTTSATGRELSMAKTIVNLRERLATAESERDAAWREAGTRDEWESELNMVRGENDSLRAKLVAAEAERDAAVRGKADALALVDQCAMVFDGIQQGDMPFLLMFDCVKKLDAMKRKRAAVATAQGEK